MLILFAFAPVIAADLTVRQSIPVNGSTNVEINALVKLVFSEQIALGEGQCTFNGQPVSATVTAVMASFETPVLNYGTTYTLYAPAGAFVAKSDASKKSPEFSFSFTTKDRPQPESRLFDAIVSADGTGDYEKVQAAINAAPSNRTKPWLIFVRNGHYKEIIRIPAEKSYIHLIGEDADSTFIEYKNCCNFGVNLGYTGHDFDKFPTVEAWGTYASRYASYDGTTVEISAPNFYSENITYRNLWGTEERNFPQALAIRCTADRTSFYHCRALSYQDTWRSPDGGKSRQYVKDCFIEGNVDFIYGNGNVLFDSCQIGIIKNHLSTEEDGWIVAPSHDGTQWGYVFKDCGLSSEVAGDSIYLGRAWIAQPMTVFLNLQLDDKIALRPRGWDSHFGNAIPIIFADWHTRNADGSFNDISQRNNYYWYEGSQGKVEGYAKQYITDEEAAKYTFDNIIPGTDGWRPDIMMERLPAPEVAVEEGRLVWGAVPYAICYEVRQDGKFVGFTTETSYACSGDPSGWQVRAVNEYGARGNLSPAVGTGVASPQVEKVSIVRREYFDLSGRSVMPWAKGIVIEHRTLSDGSSQTVRTFNKY